MSDPVLIVCAVLSIACHLFAYAGYLVVKADRDHWKRIALGQPSTGATQRLGEQP